LGYRDENDLYFRNETHATELKVKRFGNRKTTLERRGNLFGDEMSAGKSATNTIPSAGMASFKPCLQSSLSFPIDTIVVNSFFENFILSSRHPQCSSGHLKYLPTLYQNAAPDSTLTLSTAAMAFAARSIYAEHRQEYTSLALRTYGLAIQKLNAALKDPIKVRKNETLMATVMFGAIEVSQP
jgi:hypothetical protein